MKKKFVVLLLFLTVSIIGIKLNVIADVGDFETYDDYDYDSGSSFSSDFDDDDYDYSHSSGSGSSSSASDNPIVTLAFLGTFFLFIFIIYKKALSKNNSSVQNSPNNNVIPNVNEDEIVNQIKAIDENFSVEEFKSWARDLFIKLQYSWSDRDWSVIRCFESNELFEQHSTQLQRYIENKQINKIEGVSVNWVKLLRFEQTADKDVLTILLNSKMIDYIIDENTNAVLKGDKSKYNFNTYKLTFMRKKGVKTKLGESTVNTTNCPNCGAPTKITSSGECEYCGSIITTGEYNWVLTNLERYNGM